MDGRYWKGDRTMSTNEWLLTSDFDSFLNLDMGDDTNTKLLLLHVQTTYMTSKMRGDCWGTWLIMLGFMDLGWPRVCRRPTSVLLLWWQQLYFVNKRFCLLLILNSYLHCWHHWDIVFISALKLHPHVNGCCNPLLNTIFYSGHWIFIENWGGVLLLWDKNNEDKLQATTCCVTVTTQPRLPSYISNMDTCLFISVVYSIIRPWCNSTRITRDKNDFPWRLLLTDCPSRSTVWYKQVWCRLLPPKCYSTAAFLMQVSTESRGGEFVADVIVIYKDMKIVFCCVYYQIFLHGKRVGNHTAISLSGIYGVQGAESM